jgi:microcystin-dependent protein
VPLILPNTIANSIPADGDKLDQNFDTIVDWANQDAITADGSTAMVAPLLLPGAPTQPNQAATKAYVDNSVPLGVMWEYAGDAAPANWMLAQGQAISRATYAALFTVIGTRFGAGDGSTTFNLPAMQGRVACGFYPGGAWASVIGGAIGRADAAVPVHTHPGVDHLHPFSTGGASARHDHQEPSISVYQNTAAPQFYLQVAAEGFLPGAHYDLSQLASGPDRQDHSHNGNTGAADRSLTTGATGEDGSVANIPPSVVLNFIIRVS